MGVMKAVLDAVNHRAGTKEKQRLKEGMCDQVEKTGEIGAGTQRGNHEAKLGDRRISQHALDIPLRYGNEREEGGKSDHGHKLHGTRRSLTGYEEEREHTHDQEHTGRDHCGGMDDGADWGRAFHRIGQPHVQGELAFFMVRIDAIRPMAA